MPYKIWGAERVFAVDMQALMMRQVTAQFVNTGARDTAITAVTEAQIVADQHEDTLYIGKPDRGGSLANQWVPIGGYGQAADFTPVLTSTGTNPTLGTGAVQYARFRRVMGWAHANYKIVFGTTGFAAGTGTYILSLPTSHPPATGLYTGREVAIGAGYLEDSSGTRRAVTARVTGATSFRLVVDGSTADVTEVIPAAWSQSDTVFDGVLSYEVAP